MYLAFVPAFQMHYVIFVNSVIYYHAVLNWHRMMYGNVARILFQLNCKIRNFQAKPKKDYHRVNALRLFQALSKMLSLYISINMLLLVKHSRNWRLQMRKSG